MIVVGDLHLGKTTDTIEKEGIPSRLHDTIARVEEAITSAVPYDTLVMAGDIFDSEHPHTYVIDKLLDCLTLAVSREMKVYVLTGNHDCGVRYHSLHYIEDLFKGIYLITSPTFEIINNQSVLLLPHMPRADLERVIEKYGSYADYALRVIPKSHQKIIDVVIGHAHITGAENASDIEIEAGDALHFDPADYFKFKIGVFGHIHKHQTLKGGKIVYTGPVCTCAFDEAEYEKGFVRMKGQEWMFIPFSTPETTYKHITIDLVNKDELKLNPYKVREVAEGKLLKITVYAKDQMQIDKNLICKAFNEFGQVMRFESVICNKIGELEDEVMDDVFGEVDYGAILKKWLESKKLSKSELEVALKLGNEVIEEVLNAERAAG